jgi:hypothetical protein
MYRAKLKYINPYAIGQEGNLARLRQKLPAFKQNTIYIEDYVTRFIRQSVDLLAPTPKISASEFLDIFVPKEDHHILRSAFYVIGCDYSDVSATGVMPNNPHVRWLWPPVNADVQTIFPPKNTIKSEDPRANELAAWGEERIKFGFEFGKVMVLFKILNEVSKTPQQVKFYMPSLQLIVRTFGGTRGERLANDLFAPTRSSQLPRLTTAQRTLCQQVNASIATAQMVGAFDKLMPEEPVDDARVRLTLASISAREENGIKYSCIT